MKYSASLVKSICSMLASGRQSVADVCKAHEITEQTFYTWKREKPEFSESLKRAQPDRLAAIGEMALSGLAALVTEREVEEVTTEYEVAKGKAGEADKARVKGRKVTKKRILPNPTAVIFALKNRDTENWADRRELSGPAGGPIPLAIDPSKLSDAQLNQLEEILRLLTPTPSPDDAS